MSVYFSTLRIRQLADEDRPREKLLNKGARSLSNAELLAILLGTGSREQSALGLAQTVLLDCENELKQLSTRSIDRLCKIKGIGKAKAIGIAAAFELCKRVQSSIPDKKSAIRSSMDAYRQFEAVFVDLPHEEFWVIYLNRANKQIGMECISAGGITGTVVDMRLLFKKSLERLACSIIVAHNHPSGNLQPSKQDLDLTKKTKEAGKLLDIQLLDHLILADSGYYSFADEGKL